MNIYTRTPPTPADTYAYYNSYKSILDNNKSSIPVPFFHKKDLIPTHILPDYGILDTFNRKEYFYNPFFQPPVNPNNTFLYQNYPSYFPEKTNLGSGSTIDYGLQNSSMGRTIGNITY